MKESTTNIPSLERNIELSSNATGREGMRRWGVTALALVLTALAGCRSPEASTPKNLPDQTTSRSAAITLREGDVLRIGFPSSPNLDTQPQPIRRDGKITLPLIGEVLAAGFTPAELEKDLAKRYATQLESKEVSVTLVSSTYVVYVSGAVLRPGKISSDHPLSALEAIMEAGGFDNTRANLKAVTVIRQEGGRSQKHTLNLKETLKGKSPPFYLKPSDMVYVPERFTWF